MKITEINKLTQSTIEQLNLLVIVAWILKENNFTFKTDNTKEILKNCMQDTVKSSISLRYINCMRSPWRNNFLAIWNLYISK